MWQIGRYSELLRFFPFSFDYCFKLLYLILPHTICVVQQSMDW